MSNFWKVTKNYLKWFVGHGMDPYDYWTEVNIEMAALKLAGDLDGQMDYDTCRYVAQKVVGDGGFIFWTDDSGERWMFTPAGKEVHMQPVEKTSTPGMDDDVPNTTYQDGLIAPLTDEEREMVDQVREDMCKPVAPRIARSESEAAFDLVTTGHAYLRTEGYSGDVKGVLPPEIVLAYDADPVNTDWEDEEPRYLGEYPYLPLDLPPWDKRLLRETGKTISGLTQEELDLLWNRSAEGEVQIMHAGEGIDEVRILEGGTTKTVLVEEKTGKRVGERNPRGYFIPIAEMQGNGRHSAHKYPRPGEIRVHPGVSIDTHTVQRF